MNVLNVKKSNERDSKEEANGMRQPYCHSDIVLRID